MNGILVVDKPAGMTSAAVVARVKRALGAKRVGHTGTLDPMATGVLPLCIGEATKIAGYLLAEDKAYDGELLLGVTTDTLDAEGERTGGDADLAATVTREQLADVAAAFVGDIEQVPPMYSALKHQGKRLHALARKGVEVERPPRAVRIDSLELTGFAEGRASFSVHCSKGTYVRTLVDDIGRRLGCGAHLSALRRTLAGCFSLDQAIQLADISAEIELRDLCSGLEHVPAMSVPADRVSAISNGKQMSWEAIGAVEPPGVVRLMLPNGCLLALAEGQSGRIRYRRVFTYGLT
jgi:tRNA pseudouridine55 synthase